MIFLFLTIGGKNYSLGLLPPNEEDVEDEDSVAFFLEFQANLDEGLVGAPRSYNAVSLGQYSNHKKKGKRQKKRQRSSLLFGGKNLFNSLPRLLFT